MRITQPWLASGLLLSLITFNAEAALTPYTSGGQYLVYSSVSDITWTGDGNLLGTLEASDPNLVSAIISTIGSISDTPNYYDTPTGSYSGSHTLTTDDFGANGLVSWFGAQAYVSYLNIINYAGSNQWALPTAGANPQYGYDQTGGQFGQLYYNELGGVANSYLPSYVGSVGFVNTVNFIDPSSFTGFSEPMYWLGTEDSSYSNWAWDFNVNSYHGAGYQGAVYKDILYYAWAVSPGLVSAVPVPGAVWLFGTGLLGLLGLKRRGYAG